MRLRDRDDLGAKRIHRDENEIVIYPHHIVGLKHSKSNNRTIPTSRGHIQGKQRLQ